MNQTFTHPLWQRAWIVDARGIHEQRKDREFIDIPWEELQYVTTEAIRSIRGTRITPRTGNEISFRLRGSVEWLKGVVILASGNTPQRRRELVSAITHEWRRLYPERELENKQRRRRQAARAVYMWLPAVLLAPPIGFYIWAWYWPRI